VVKGFRKELTQKRLKTHDITNNQSMLKEASCTVVVM